MFTNKAPINILYTLPKEIPDSNGNIPTDTWSNIRVALEEGNKQNTFLASNYITMLKAPTDRATGLLKVAFGTLYDGDVVVKLCIAGTDEKYTVIHKEELTLTKAEEKIDLEL